MTTAGAAPRSSAARRRRTRALGGARLRRLRNLCAGRRSDRRANGVGRGVTAWSPSVPGPGVDIDGLVTEWSVAPAPAAAAAHPNGAIGLDHVVAVTPDFERTAARLAGAGLPLSRVRHGGPENRRQGFRRLGPAILEIVEVAQPESVDAPARLWGLTVIVADQQALDRRLGDRLGPVRPAVQSGRRIAVLRESAGLSAAVAFMDPS